MKRLFIAVVIAFASVGGAKAAVVTNPNDLFLSGEETFFKLTDFERLIDVANPGSAVGRIDPGDRLRGIFNITNSQNQFGSDIRVPSGFELTGIFEATVSRVVPTGGGTALFEFVPYAPFAAEFSLAAGAMTAFYVDTTPNFTALGTIAATENSAAQPPSKGGTDSLFFSLGASGDWGDVNADGNGYYWAATGSLTPGVAAFAASLALLNNNTSFTASQFAAETQAPPIHSTGSFTNEAALGSIQNEFALQGNTLPFLAPGSPYRIISQDPLRATIVPEATALLTWLLLGSVSVGFAVVRRIRAH